MRYDTKNDFQNGSPTGVNIYNYLSCLSKLTSETGFDTDKDRVSTLDSTSGGLPFGFSVFTYCSRYALALHSKTLFFLFSSTSALFRLFVLRIVTYNIY